MDESVIRSDVQLVGVVRDKTGRIVIDEAVLLDECKLKQIVEAIKHGRNASDSNP